MFNGIILMINFFTLLGSAGTGKPLCGAIYTDATSGQTFGVTGGFDCTIRKWKM